jgi:DNA repair protein RecO (recombination protein O)
VQLQLARGRDLDIITQAEAIDTYPGLRDDLVRLGQAAYVIELMDRFTVEREVNQALYRLLINTLERLIEGVEPAIVLRHYELRLLDQVGYRPELFRCLGCSEDILPQDQYFSPSEGGAICSTCGPSRTDVSPLSLAALKVLRHYQRNSFDVASSAKIRPQVHVELEQVMEGYLSYLLERRLNAPEFLRRVRRIIGDQLEPDVII